MSDEAYEQILALRELPGCPNLLDVLAAFEFALKHNMDTAADYIFMSTDKYAKFIITGIRE